MDCRLGIFDLRFEPSGKLASLSVDGGPSVLAAGPLRAELAPGRVFEPRGWDECFPTIDPHGASQVMGDLAWQAPALALGRDGAVQTWQAAGYTASRTFSSPAPRTLEVRFMAENRSASPLSFLWASHALFSPTGLRRVVFADGLVLDDLSPDGSSAKLFRPNRGPLTLEREEGALVLSSDQPWWGIWLNRGGWPAGSPGGAVVIGLEAASADRETPGADCIAPGGRFTGCVRLEAAA